MSLSLAETVNVELVQSAKEVEVTNSSTKVKHQQTVEETKSLKLAPAKNFNHSRSSDSGKSSSCSPILLDCSFDSGIAGVLLDSNHMQLHKRIQQCQCIILALQRDREYYCTIRNRLSKLTNRKKKPSNENEFFCNVCCAEIHPEDDKTFVKCYICHKYICRSIKCADWLPKTAEWECELCQTSKESLAQTSSWVADQISFHQEKIIHPPRARSEIYIPISECNDSSIHFESVSQIGANSAIVTAEQKLKIREYVEEVVAKLLGGNLDTIAVNQLSKSENYLPDPKSDITHNGILRESERVKASNTDFTDISENRLRQMIQKIIAETLSLPPLSKVHAVSEIALDRRGKSAGNRPLTNGCHPRHRTEHYFEPIIYQDLLATAVLNKIVDKQLNNNHEVSGSNTSDSGGGGGGGIGDEVNDNIRHAGSDQNLNIEKLSTSSGSSVEPRSDCSYPDIEQTNDDKSSELIRNSDRESVMSDYLAFHMIPLPDLNAMATESDEDDYMSVTSSTVGDGTWEKNWLFKKKKSALTNSVTANSVGMLVPDPKEDVRAQIGDKTADEVSDLSELGSDTDDSLDSLQSKLEPFNDRLINKHLIGGQNNKMVLDELIERNSVISNTLQSSQDPSYTDACNENVIDFAIKNEAINDNVTQQATTMEHTADILGAALCSVVLEDPNSNSITASDDNSDSEGCTGFSAIEIIEPPLDTPSVVEILAAMALGPMLAVSSVDQPATLSVSDFNVFTDLKELALAEIKARSLELTPRNLDVIPEEMGDTTNTTENIIDYENSSTSGDTNDGRFVNNLTTATELNLNTYKEIPDINLSEISSSSTESLICSTDRPVIETTDDSAKDKTSNTDESNIILTKDQELKETPANISTSSTFEGTKFILVKSHFGVDENTEEKTNQELNKPISKITELSVNDIPINSEKQEVETHLQETSDHNSNEIISESVESKDETSLSASTQLQCTSELINYEASLVCLKSSEQSHTDKSITHETIELHEQVPKELPSEIKLQDISDLVNIKTLSSHLESDGRANAEMHINNESNNQCHDGENNLEKYPTQQSGQNISEITLKDTSDSTYKKAATSTQSNTKENLLLACSKEPDKDTSKENDSEKPLELNEIELKGCASKMQLQVVLDSMKSEALSTSPESDVQSKTEDNTSTEYSKLINEPISKEQPSETHLQQNFGKSFSHTPPKDNSDTILINVLSQCSESNIQSNTEGNAQNSQTTTEIVSREHSSEMCLESTAKVSTEENTSELDKMIPKEQSSETLTKPNELASKEPTSESECSETNVESKTEDNIIDGNLNVLEGNISRKNSRALDDTVSEVQDLEPQKVPNEIVAKTQAAEKNLVFSTSCTKNEPKCLETNTKKNTFNEHAVALDEIISKERSSKTQMEQNEIVSEGQTSNMSASSQSNVESKTEDNSSDLNSELQTTQNDNVEEQSSNIQQEDKTDCTHINALPAPSDSNVVSKSEDALNERLLDKTISEGQTFESHMVQNKAVSQEQSSNIPIKAISDSMKSEPLIASLDTENNISKNNFTPVNETEQPSEPQTEPTVIVIKQEASEINLKLTTMIQQNVIVLDAINDDKITEYSPALDKRISKEQSFETQTEQKDIALEEDSPVVSSSLNVESKTKNNTSDEETISQEQPYETLTKQNELKAKTGCMQIEDVCSASNIHPVPDDNTLEKRFPELNKKPFSQTQTDQNEIVSEEETVPLSTFSDSNMQSKPDDNISDKKSSVLDETLSNELQVEQNEKVSEELTSAFSASLDANAESKTEEISSDKNAILFDEITPKVQNEIVVEEQPSSLPTSSESNIESTKPVENTSDEKSSVLDKRISQEQCYEIVPEQLTSALSASSEANVDSKTEVTKQTKQNKIELDMEFKTNEISSNENTIVFEDITPKIHDDIVLEQQPSALSTCSESNIEFTGDNTSDKKSSALEETITEEQFIAIELNKNESELTAALSTSSESIMDSKTSDEKSKVFDVTISKQQSNETRVGQNEIVPEEIISTLSASSEANAESKTAEISSTENTIVFEDIASKIQNEVASEEQPSALSTSSESNVKSKTVENTSDQKSSVLDETQSNEQSTDTLVNQNEIVSEQLTPAFSTSAKANVDSKTEEAKQTDQNKIELDIEVKTNEILSNENTIVFEDITPKIHDEIVLEQQPSALLMCSESNMESRTGDNTSDKKSSALEETITEEQSIAVELKQNESEQTAALSPSAEEQPLSLSTSSESVMDSKTSDEKSKVLNETILKQQSNETRVEQNEIVPEEIISTLSASSEANAESKTAEISSTENTIVFEDIAFKIQNEVASEQQPSALSTSSESNVESKTVENTSDQTSSVLDETQSNEQSTDTQVNQNEIVSEHLTPAFSASGEATVDSKTEEAKQTDQNKIVLDIEFKTNEILLNENTIVFEDITPKIHDEIVLEQQPSALPTYSESNMESRTGDTTSDKKSRAFEETITEEQSIAVELKQNESEQTAALSPSAEEQPLSLSTSSESVMDSKTSDEKSKVLNETILQQQSNETRVEQNEIVSEELTSTLLASLEANTESKTEEISALKNTIVFDDIDSQIQNKIVSEEQKSALSTSSESTTTSDEKSSVLRETIFEEQSYETQVKQNKADLEEIMSQSASSEEKPSALSDSSKSNIEPKSGDNTSDEISGVLDETISKEELTSALSDLEEQPLALSTSPELNMESKISDEKSSATEQTISKEQSYETQVKQNEIVLEELKSTLSTALSSFSREQSSAFPNSSGSKSIDNTSNEKSSDVESINKEQFIATQMEQNEMFSKVLTSALSTLEEQPLAFSTSTELDMESKIADEKSSVIEQTNSKEQSYETQVNQNEIVLGKLTPTLSASSKEQPSASSNSSESKSEDYTSDEKPCVLDESIYKQQSGETQIERNDKVSKVNVDSKTEEILSIENTIVFDEIASRIQNKIVSEEQLSDLSSSSESDLEYNTADNTLDEKYSVLDKTIPKNQYNETQLEQDETVSEEQACALCTSLESNMDLHEKLNVLDETISIEQSIATHIKQNEIVSDELTSALSASANEQPLALFTSPELNMESKMADEKSSVIEEAIPKEQSNEIQVKKNEIVVEELTSTLSASLEAKPSTSPNSLESKSGDNTLDEKSSVLDEPISKEQSDEAQVVQNDKVSEANVKTEEISSRENTIVFDDIIHKLQTKIVLEEQPSDLSSSSETNLEYYTADNILDEKYSVIEQTIPKKQYNEEQLEQNETVSEEQLTPLSISSESNIDSHEKSNVLDEIASIEQIATQVEQNETVSEELTSALSSPLKEKPLAFSTSPELNMESKIADEKSSVMEEAISKEQSNETQVKQNEIAVEELTSTLSASLEEQPSTSPNSSESKNGDNISDEKPCVLDESIFKEQVEQNAEVSEANVKTEEISSIENTIVIDEIASRIQNKIVSEEQSLALSTCSESKMEHNTLDEKLSVLDETIPKKQYNEAQLEENEIVSENLTSALSASAEANVDSKTEEAKQIDQNKIGLDIEFKTNKISSNENTTIFEDISPKTHDEIVLEQQISALSTCSESIMESGTGDNTSDKKSRALEETITEEQSIAIELKQNESELTAVLSPSVEEQPLALSASLESNMDSKTSDEKSSVLDETSPKEHSNETRMKQNEIVPEEITSTLSAASEANAESKTDKISSIGHKIVFNDIASKIQNKIVSEELTSAFSASLDERSSALSTLIDTNMKSIILDEKSGVLDETTPGEQSYEEVTSTLTASSEEKPITLSNSSKSNIEPKNGDNTSDEISGVLDETISKEELTSALSASLEEQPLALSTSPELNMESKISNEKLCGTEETISKEQSYETGSSESKSGDNTLDEKSRVLDEFVSKQQTDETQVEQNDKVSEANLESKTEEISSRENTIVVDDIASRIQNKIVSEVQPSDLSTSSESNMESKISDEKSSFIEESISKEQSNETQVKQNEIALEELSSTLTASSEEQPSNSSKSYTESKSGDNIVTSDEISTVLDESIYKELSIATQVEQNEIVSEELTSALSSSLEEQPLALSTSSELNMEAKIANEKSGAIEETISKEQPYETQVEQNEIVLEELTSTLSASSEEQTSNSSNSNMESKSADNTYDAKSNVHDESISREQSVEAQVVQNDKVSEANVESKTEEILSIENAVVFDDTASRIQNKIVSEQQLSDVSTSSESNMECNTADSISDEKSSVFDETIPKKQFQETQLEQNERVSENLISALTASLVEQSCALSASSESNMDSHEKSSVTDKTISIATQVEQNEIVSEELTSAISASLEKKPLASFTSSELNMESKISDEKLSAIEETISKEQSYETQVKQNEIVLKELSSTLSASLKEQPSPSSNSESKSGDNTSDEKSSDESISKEQSKETQVERNDKISEANVETKDISSIENAIQFDKIQNKIFLEEQSSALLTSSESNMKSNAGNNISDAKFCVLEETVRKRQHNEKQLEQKEIVSENVTSALSTSSESNTDSHEKSSVHDETISIKQSIATQIEQSEIVSQEIASALSTSLEELPLPSPELNIISDEKSSVLDESIPKQQFDETQVERNDKVSKANVESKTEDISSFESTKVCDDIALRIQNKIVSEEKPSDLSTSSSDERSSALSTIRETKMEYKISHEKSSALDETISEEQSFETQVKPNEEVLEELTSTLPASSEEQLSAPSNLESKCGDNKSDEESCVFDESISQQQSNETQVDRNDEVSEANVKTEEISSIENTIVFDDISYTIKNEIISEEQSSDLFTFSESNKESNTGDNTLKEKSSVLEETIPKKQYNDTLLEQNEIVSLVEQSSALSSSSESNMNSHEKSSVIDEKNSIEQSIASQMEENKIISEANVNVEKTEKIVSTKNTIVFDDIASKIENEALPQCSESITQSTTEENTSDKYALISNEQSTINTEAKTEENATNKCSRVLNETISKEESSETQTEQNKIVSTDQLNETSKQPVCIISNQEIFSNEQSAEIPLDVNLEYATNEAGSGSSISTSDEHLRTLDERICKVQPSISQLEQHGDNSNEQLTENIDALSGNSEYCVNNSSQPFETQSKRNKIDCKDQLNEVPLNVVTDSLNNSVSSETFESIVLSKAKEDSIYNKALSDSAVSTVQSTTDQIISESSAILSKDISDSTNNNTLSPSSSIIESTTEENTSDKQSGLIVKIISNVESFELTSKTPIDPNVTVLREQLSEIPVDSISNSSRKETLSGSLESSVQTNSKAYQEIISKGKSSETQQEQNKQSSEITQEGMLDATNNEPLPKSLESIVQFETEDEKLGKCSKGPDKIISEQHSSKASNECSKDLDKTISKEQCSQTQPKENYIILKAEKPIEEISDSTFDSSMQPKAEENILDEALLLDETISEVHRSQMLLENLTKSLSVCSESSEQTNSKENTLEHSKVLDRIICKVNCSEAQQDQNEIGTNEQSPKIPLEIVSEVLPTSSLESAVQPKSEENTAKECLKGLDETTIISNEHLEKLDKKISKEPSSETLQNNVKQDIRYSTINEHNEIVSNAQSSVKQLQDTLDSKMNEALFENPESNVQTNTEETSSDEPSKVLDEIISKVQSSETLLEQNEVVTIGQPSEMVLEDISNPSNNKQNEIVLKEQISIDPSNSEPMSDSSESFELTKTKENTSQDHLILLDETVLKEQPTETQAEPNEIISKTYSSEIPLECNLTHTINESLSEISESKGESKIFEITSVEHAKALDEIISKEQLSKLQPEQDKQVLNEQSSEIALEDIDSTRIEVQKELVSKEKSCESQAEQKDVVLQEKSADVQLQTISDTNFQSNAKQNVLDECSKELQTILEVQISEIKQELTAEAQLKLISEYKNDEDLPECLENNVQYKTDQKNLTEYLKEPTEQLPKEHLSLLEKHEIADSANQEALTKDLGFQCKSADSTTADISGGLNDINVPTNNTSSRMPATSVPMILSEPESNLKPASGVTTEEATLNILGEQISVDDSPTITRQSTVIEMEEDNYKAADLCVEVPEEQQQQGKHNISKKLQRQYRVVDTTPSFEDVSPQSMPQTMPPSTANSLAGLCQKFIHDKHLLTALENRRRRTLLMHRFLSTLDLSSNSTDESSMEETNRVHTEVLIAENPVVCETFTSTHDHDSDHDDYQLSYESKPYADSRTNTIEEYIDNENDEKDILPINYNNNSTTNIIITNPTFTTTTTTNSSTATNSMANTNHNNTNKNDKQPITATTTSNQMRQYDPLTSAVQNKETSSRSQCVQQLISNDQLNIQILTDARDNNGIDVNVGVLSDVDGVSKDDEEDDDDDVAIMRCFVPGSIAEREYKKWYNAVEMPNNPYAPEALKRRISGSQERFIDLPNMSPTKDLNTFDSLNSQQLEADENVTRESDYKRYSRDYYINSSLTTPQLSPAKDVSEHATKKDNRESTNNTLSSTESETELNLYKAIPAQVVEHISSCTDGMSTLSREEMEENTTTTSDDSDTIKMYDFKTQQEIIKDATTTHREQAKDDVVNTKERPSSLAFSRSESDVNIVTPTRGSTPTAFKFLQPKRKLLEPNQVLSVEENEPQIVYSPSEKPVIEAEIAKALPSVKALARAFLMTTNTTQHEKLWLRKARTLSQGGKKRSCSPKRSLDHLMKSEQAKPEDDITITSDLSSLETDSSSTGIEIATTSDISTPAISLTNDPTLPTDNTGNISPVPVRQGILKNNIAFFENLKNK